MSTAAVRTTVPRRAYFPVLATGLIANVYSDFMLVVAPLWALMLGAGPGEIGLMVGARSILPCLLAIHGGVLMDRWGTRRVMLVFTAVIALLVPLYPLSPWFPALVALQMLTGLFTNLSWIGAQTLIARLGRGEARYLGVFSFCSRAGSIGAPLVIGLIWDLGGAWIAFGACAVVASGQFASTLLVPRWAEHGSPEEAETALRDTPVRPRIRWRDLMPRMSDYAGCLALLAIPAVALGIVIALMRHTPSTIQASFYITYLKEVGLSATAIGALIACAEVTGAFGSLLAAPAMERLPVHWLMVAFTALTIAMITLTPLLGGVFVVLAAAQVLRGIGHGLLHPATFSYIAKALHAGAQAQGVALRTTGNRLGALVLPIVMGLVAEVIGVEASFLVIGGGLLVLVAVIAALVARNPAFRQPS